MINKPEILVVLSRFPFPLEKGDKLRAYHQIKQLSSNFTVNLVSITDKEIPKDYIQEIEKICSEVFVFRINWLTKIIGIISSFFNGKPFQTGYFYRSSIKNSITSIVEDKEIKHIYSQLVRTTEYTKDIHHIPKTLDYMDALSTGIERRIELQPFHKKWLFRLEAKRLKKYERHVFDFFENRTIISDQDKRYISHPDREAIISIPNGIDSKFFEDTVHNSTYDFVFVGNMSYPPNIEAVHYIAQEILPKLDNATLLISGATPHPSLAKLAQANKNIHLTGWIDDIRDSYRNGKIFLAPMMIGTGMQNKLLEAMAMRIPCITTSLANNAIKAIVDEEILVGDNQTELIEACEKLLANEKLRETIANNAYTMAKDNFNWENSTNKLIELIQATI